MINGVVPDGMFSCRIINAHQILRDWESQPFETNELSTHYSGSAPTGRLSAALEPDGEMGSISTLK